MLCGWMVGISLGLTGGGGSIFAVPLLLYIPGLPLHEAIMVSLAVVGLTSLYGAILRRHLVRWSAGAVLGLGGLLGAPLGAWAGQDLSEFVTLLLFAGLIIGIGFNLLRGSAVQEIPLNPLACRHHPDDHPHFQVSCAATLLVAGVLTGALSGLFGIGGGFLLVPALLWIGRMAPERTLATSLVGIFLVSWAALAANLLHQSVFPWKVAFHFLSGGTLGMTSGALVKRSLPSAALRRIFAAAMIGVAGWISLRCSFQYLAPVLPSAATQVTPLQESELRERGARVAQRLFSTLMGRLQSVMRSDGPIAAVAVCQKEALELTHSVAAEFETDGVTSVQRIGVRVRKVNNRSDETDQDVLADWRSRVQSGGERSRPRIMRVTRPDEWRFYQPVLTAPNYLIGHGRAETPLRKIQESVRAPYPHDQASSLNEGELRGAIVITFSQPVTAQTSTPNQL